MITVYAGNTYADCAKYVTESILRENTETLSKKYFVIVPDRASLEAENLMLDAMQGSFAVQILTMRRLFLRLQKQPLEKAYLTKQSAIIAISNIVEEHKEEFVYFKKGFRTKGFAETVYETICQLKYCSIQPDDLKKANLPQSLQGKIADVVLLYKKYVEFLQNGYFDSADKLTLLAQLLDKTSDLRDCNFYFYDFDNYTVQELSIIEKLMKKANAVTVACCFNDKKSWLFPNDIFDSVVSLCKRNGLVYQVVHGQSHFNAQTKQIGDVVYSYVDESKINRIPNNEFFSLFKGEGRVQEVYELACLIQQYVRSGKRFKDVFVVTSDIKSYENAVSLVFSEFNIPYFLDTKTKLSDHVFCQFICDYLAFCDNKTINNAIALVKNPFFDSESEKVWSFENYCLKYNVKFDFSSFDLGKSEPFFQDAESVRQTLWNTCNTTPFDKKNTVQNYVLQVREFIKQTRLEEKLEAFAKAQESKNIVEHKVSLQVAEKFETTLCQLENILANKMVSLKDFRAHLEIALEAIDVSIIPERSDCVIFANMAKARKHDVKFLAVLGANQGLLPMIKKDYKILTDKNIKDLSSCGVFVSPLISLENKRERFSLYQLLQEAQEKLFVSYSTTTGKEPLVASTFVNEMKKLFAPSGEISQSDQKVYTRNQALAKIVSAKRRQSDNQPVRLPTFKLLEKIYDVQLKEFIKESSAEKQIDCGKELFLAKEATSVSKITDYTTCPYKFFFNYGLGVKKREKAELESNELGNVLHSVLENYVKDFDEKETDEQTVQKAWDLFEKVTSSDFFVGLKKDWTTFRILQNLKNESAQLCIVVKKQFENTAFKNKFAELEFGNDDVPYVKVEFGNEKFLLRGKIDRVDTKDDKFIVIDYKSGSAESATFSEQKLYYGQKLQLLVYVLAVKEKFNYKPVGFYYFQLKNKFEKEEDSNKNDYSGRTLADVEIAKQLDFDLERTGKSEKLNLSLTKKGEFSNQGNAHVSQQELDAQLDYAKKFIASCGLKMKQGNIDVNPLEKACSFCDYRNVCDFGDTLTNTARKMVGAKQANYKFAKTNDDEKTN